MRTDIRRTDKCSKRNDIRQTILDELAGYNFFINNLPSLDHRMANNHNHVCSEGSDDQQNCPRYLSDHKSLH